jgi:SagB-type dehydrogenase family enzyme
MELRRSPHLVWYWRDDQLVMYNYALNRAVVSQPVVLDVLERFHSWTLLEPFLAAHPADLRESLRELVEALIRDRWLWHRGEPLLDREVAMDDWAGWNPAAGFFHAAAKDPQIVGLDDLLPRLSAQAKSRPMPPVAKAYPGVPVVPLDGRSKTGSFSRVLRERRTWRRFGPEPLELRALSTLLDLSAGVQAWAEAASEGRVALKTSPSGGARHPIEVYLAVRNVCGLDAGLYHFAAHRNELERLSTAPPPAFEEFLPSQSWYNEASALVFFTAVFERTRWRYNGPRAYRAVTIEAGHVCQTFCLTATWLGLAPFCSMALADSAIERALGIDGITESVLYAAGVGTRPALARGQLPGMLPPDGSLR